MPPTTQENDFGGTTEERVTRLVHYATRHGFILSQYGEALHEIREKLVDIERERLIRAASEAREDERNKMLVAEIAALKDAVAGMKGVVNKAVLVILGTVGVAFIKWVMDGNLGGVS